MIEVPGVKPVQGFTTSDGMFFNQLDDAEDHQRDLEFHDWCTGHVCTKGAWTPKMVADTILQDWIVLPKSRQ